MVFVVPPRINVVLGQDFVFPGINFGFRSASSHALGFSWSITPWRRQMFKSRLPVATSMHGLCCDAPAYSSEGLAERIFKCFDTPLAAQLRQRG